MSRRREAELASKAETGWTKPVCQPRSPPPALQPPLGRQAKPTNPDSMTLRGYRIIIFGLAAWITLCLPSIAAPWGRPSSGLPETLWRCGAFFGFGLVSIAAFGLWRERSWGIWLLVVAAIAASITFGSRGILQLFSICALHYILLAVVLLRRFCPRPRLQPPTHNSNATGNA